MMPNGIAEYIRSKGGAVVLDAEVVSIQTEDDVVTSVSYEQDGNVQTIECDACISTIPLNTMVGILRPEPSTAVMEACQQLKYKAIVIYGILVKKEQVFDDALYVYFRDRIFHRISEPQNSGVEVTPEGHTTLLLELTCNVGDDRWTGSEGTINQIKADLEAEKLLTRDQIVEIHRLNAEHGYPVYELDFEPFLDILNAKVDSLVNLRSTGRQGGFTYPDMHKAMRMGSNAAEEILDLVQGQGTGQREENLVPG
jgi:protoporphyrinogen oxidase